MQIDSPILIAYDGSDDARHAIDRTAAAYPGASSRSGIGMLDFSNPASAREIAYADPARLSTTSLVSGGDWSTYWYGGRIYESDITRGFMTWNPSDSAVAGAKKLRHRNPQTQELTLL